MLEIAKGKENSGYGIIVNGLFQSTYPLNHPLRQFHMDAQRYFKTFVGREDFPCIAGRTVARTDQYAFCAYPDMTNPNIAPGLLHDMLRFQKDFVIPHAESKRGPLFRSFIAAFQNPKMENAFIGTRALYTLLGNLHTENSKYFPWVEGYSNDPNSDDFGYSLGRSAFFLAFFHAEASEDARKSELAFLVFNSHSMLDTLKIRGVFIRLRDTIRSRQWRVHPLLGDHGKTNEWVQYALLPEDELSQMKERMLREEIFGLCPFHKT